NRTRIGATGVATGCEAVELVAPDDAAIEGTLPRGAAKWDRGWGKLIGVRIGLGQPAPVGTHHAGNAGPCHPRLAARLARFLLCGRRSGSHRSLDRSGPGMANVQARSGVVAAAARRRPRASKIGQSPHRGPDCFVARPAIRRRAAAAHLREPAFLRSQRTGILEAGLHCLPGAFSAAFSDLPVPAGEQGWKETVSPSGADGNPELSVLATLASVSPGFFKTLAIPLVSGRDFEWSDDQRHSPIAIVDSQTPAGCFLPAARSANASVLACNRSFRISRLLGWRAPRAWSICVTETST